jgi:predicted membrane protein
VLLPGLGESATFLVSGRFRRLVSQVLRTFQECKNMPLLNIVIALIVVGVALWLINRFIPMASSIKTILNVVVVVAVCVWVLRAAGLWTQISSFRLSR